VVLPVDQAARADRLREPYADRGIEVLVVPTGRERA
jgi:hypothetical protein